MAICNRDLDSSEQKDVLMQNYGAWGVTNMPLIRQVAAIDSPCNLVSARTYCAGVSGSPVALLQIRRFITGAGATVYTGGATSLALVTIGTSGIQSVITAASGSTALQLQSGDVLEVAFSGADSAVSGFAVAAVIQYTQDIKTYFGS